MLCCPSPLEGERDVRRLRAAASGWSQPGALSLEAQAPDGVRGRATAWGRGPSGPPPSWIPFRAAALLARIVQAAAVELGVDAAEEDAGHAEIVSGVDDQQR